MPKIIEINANMQTIKAICIKKYDEVNSRTTIGKVYEIYQYNKDNTIDAYFVGDNGDELWYDPNYFTTIEQHRENQINKLYEN